jgi:hypothetical protein
MTKEESFALSKSGVKRLFECRIASTADPAGTRNTRCGDRGEASLLWIGSDPRWRVMDSDAQVESSEPTGEGALNLRFGDLDHRFGDSVVIASKMSSCASKGSITDANEIVESSD